jgi:hypothetical protein
MGVILEDSSGADLTLNWWTWRPIVELLRAEALVDDQEAELLQINGVGAGLDGDIAAAASRIIDALISSMPAGSRLLRDGSISTAPQELEPLSDFGEHWYGAGREALETFRDFCTTSGGFTVH